MRDTPVEVCTTGRGVTNTRAIRQTAKAASGPAPQPPLFSLPLHNSFPGTCCECASGGAGASRGVAHGVRTSFHGDGGHIAAAGGHGGMRPKRGVAPITPRIAGNIYTDDIIFTRKMTLPCVATAQLDLEQIREAAAEASAMLRMLGNPDRLLLLCQLSQSELCVTELEEAVGIAQPTLSQQLSVLRSQGLVRTRREGKRIYYCLSDRKALVLLDTLYQLYCG